MFKFLTVLAFFGFVGAADAAVTVHVQNDRGIPQLSEIYIGEYGYAQTNENGDAFIDPLAGDSISATRSHYQTCAPGADSPEGIANPAYSVMYQGQSAITITLPTITTTPYEPAVNPNESWVVARINQDRAANGLPPLVIYDKLNQASDNFANHINNTGAYSHCGLYGLDARLADVGWPSWEGNLETIVIASTPYEAYDKWAKSPDHYRVLLNQTSTAVGIGVVGNYWVIDFTDPACNVNCGGSQGSGNINAIPQAPIVQTPQNTYIPQPPGTQPNQPNQPRPPIGNVVINEPQSPVIVPKSQRLGKIDIDKSNKSFQLSFSRLNNPSSIKACFSKGKTKKCHTTFRTSGSGTIKYTKKMPKLSKGRWKLTITAGEKVEGNVLWLGDTISKNVSF